MAKRSSSSSHSRICATRDSGSLIAPSVADAIMEGCETMRGSKPIDIHPVGDTCATCTAARRRRLGSCYKLGPRPRLAHGYDNVAIPACDIADEIAGMSGAGFRHDP